MAQTIALDGDLGADGEHRRCRYVNGDTYLVMDKGPCPAELTVEPDLGHLVRTYVEGIARYCIYRTSDRAEPIRVASNEPCPVSFRFTPVR